MYLYVFIAFLLLISCSSLKRPPRCTTQRFSFFVELLKLKDLVCPDQSALHRKHEAAQACSSLIQSNYIRYDMANVLWINSPKLSSFESEFSLEVR